jgi:hypothetical protein
MGCSYVGRIQVTVDVPFFFELSSLLVDCTVVPDLLESVNINRYKLATIMEEQTLIWYGGSQFAHFDEAV